MIKLLQSASITAIFLSGCIATPFYGKPMTHRIVDDTRAFNEALAEASSAQILQNVLYARDRMPRQYSGFKDIATMQQRTLTASPEISTIPLGNPADSDADEIEGGAKLWGVGKIGITGTAQTSPNYGLSPIVGSDFNKAVVGATDDNVFKAYWDSGWPRDVLVTVLVEELIALKEVTCIHPPKPTPSGTVAKCYDYDRSNVVSNDVEAYIRTLSPSTPNIPLPAFVQHANAFADRSRRYQLDYQVLQYGPQSQIEIEVGPNAIDDSGTKSLNDLSNGLEALVDAGFSIQLSQGGAPVLMGRTPLNAGISRSSDTKRQLVIKGPSLSSEEDSVVWAISLRSFDKAISYLGELVRYKDGDTGYYGPPNFIRNADGQSKCLAPLFRVRVEEGLGRFTYGAPNYDDAEAEARGDDPVWAASMQYRGQWYFAGKASPHKIDCSDSKVDRTATVLTLLGQIFELNRSAENLRLPARLN